MTTWKGVIHIEEQQLTVNEGEENIQAESSPVNTNPILDEDGIEIPQHSEEAQEESQEGIESVEHEEQPKKGAQQRIKEVLNQKDEYKALAVKEREARISLEKQIAELTGSVEPQFDFNAPQSPLGEEITPEQYQADVQKKAMQAAYLINQQQRNLDRINQEANASIQKYEALNPDSDNYNDKLSASVTKATLAFVKANPTGSVKEFVQDLMEPYLEAVGKEVGKREEILTKQVSESAMRPTQAPKAGEKPFSELSIEEMEAKLGLVY